jgi:molybdopterin synthase catalytic subunit
MEPGEDIVLVITCAAHRQAAFEACEFLMDWLKTKAPFWKLEEGEGESGWVDARESDDAAASRWNKTSG